MVAALIGYWLALFVSTHVPIEPQISVPGEDKTLHFVGYGVLAFLFGTTLVLQGRTLSKTILLTLLILPTYAALDELTQSLVGRHCDFHDWLADLGGIAIGLCLAYFVSGLTKARLSHS